MWKQNWLASLGLLVSCWKAEEHWEGEHLFNLVHSCKETFFRFIGELTCSPFQKAILPVSKEFSFIYSSHPRTVAIPKTRLGERKSTSWTASRNLVLFCGFLPPPTPPFSPVLHVLPVLMTTQTLLSRTSHSAWDNSHVLTRQTFVCGWL